MGRDAATDDASQAPVGRVRVASDNPADSDPPATSRDMVAKIALGVGALLIMVATLALILQLAIGVAGP